MENKNTMYANILDNKFKMYVVASYFRCKPARDFLLSHSAEWQWAVGWLRKKVRHGHYRCIHTLNQFCPSQLSSDYKWSQSSSNETSHSKSFQRTVSAQVNYSREP
jgi:hypothetical protein